ncbi:MAG: Hsp33 family molecular chaperone HslO [Lachnospiraceae bacterium]|nr:Hsp33 family molecular chaperone HslO [Lachnospiraceae bacterium]
MTDYIVRATAAGGVIRAFAATTRETVETARQHHNTSPVATAALGRLLTAGAVMGSMMKGENDLLTLQIKGDGPLGGITVTANSRAEVKGYVNNPSFVNPPNALGKLDVGGAIGYGSLTVIRDLGLKEPYSGTVELVTGEIAEDLAYYYSVSEQTPSGIGLGVLMNKDNTVRCAGGFMLQLMPGADQETALRLEEKLKGVSSVTKLLDSGLAPADILKQFLSDMDLEINDVIPCCFKCMCSKERISAALSTLSREDLSDLIKEGAAEIRCSFCNTTYSFSSLELKELLLKRGGGDRQEKSRPEA